ncbi:MAG: glycogen debranching protein [Solirubrobacteraceae bacterium]
MAPATAAAAPELSVADRLQDRRALVSGERAYSVGFQDGGFYANGWHITGEMGGVWTPPLKLVDGVWFGIDGQWVGQASEFRSGWGYTEMDFPDTAGVGVKRIDSAADGGRAVLFGLELTNPSHRKRTATVMVDAHSELMGAYPWGFDTAVPNARDNLADTAAFDGRRLEFREQGRLPHPNAEVHDWAALVGSDRRPVSGSTGTTNRGDQGNTVCPAQAPAPDPMPSVCDDGPFGRGQGGQLRYEVRLKGHDSETLWIAVAGSDEGLAKARAELDKATADPERALKRKVRDREEASRWTKLSLPGDRRLQAGIDWGKQNLIDSTQAAEDLEVRHVDQGRQYPPPAGEVPYVRFRGAGWPDYPWMFGTDGEYTAFASVALGQFEPTMDHMRGLRDVSEIANNRSGKLVHEVVTDGSIWFGSNTDPGNTDETVKFPSIVALLWRWTGDDSFRDEMYDFTKRNLEYAAENLDEDGDGWLEGLGNVERPGMGEEKLDNNVYYIRGLYDLADMAGSKRDGATYRWAKGIADDLRGRFEAEWWMDDQSLHADSLGETNNKIQQRHWITGTPMDAILKIGNRTVPGLADREHGDRSLALHETPCFSGERPYNRGLFHTACGGGPTGAGERTIFTLNTAIQAVGEGNYGRLGAEQQKRYIDANIETMFSQPATNGTPDEMPGAMPEIVPSPDFDPTGPNDKNIDRCWTCRAMFIQAWGNMGTAWPVVNQHFGVRPDLGRGRLEVVPQLPSDAPIAARDIRLGDGSVDVKAARYGKRYVTKVDTHKVDLRRLRIGHTLARGSDVRSVKLDGRRVQWRERRTNRGLEVSVRAWEGDRTLVVEAR